jgi:uncharacterized membrane protein
VLKSYEIAAATVLLLVILSLIADLRFQSLRKIPMHWGLDGKPTWSAPRVLGLAFMPLLATIVLAAVAVQTAMLPTGTTVILLISLVFVAVHLLHLWLIQKTTAR